MDNSLAFGRVHGIGISVHYSWLLVLALLTASLALSFYPATFPGIAQSTGWLLGMLSALGLLASVLLHELAHSLVAQSRGLAVQGITLFIFGGLAKVETEPRQARDELLIAAAGPLASLALGVVSALGVLGARLASLELVALFTYLALANVLLALFNLIPGFPLDGGRVLRGLLWQLTGDLGRATAITSVIGQGVGYLLIFGGLLLFVGGAYSGLWLALSGWFLSSVADSARRQNNLRRALHGRRVQDLMLDDPLAVVPADLPLLVLVEDYFLRRSFRVLPVVGTDGRLVGLVSVESLKSLPSERWETARAADVMTPADHLLSLEAHQVASEALFAAGRRLPRLVPVVDGGRPVGFLSPAHLQDVLRAPEESEERAA